MTKAKMAQSVRFVNTVAYNGLTFLNGEKGQNTLWTAPAVLRSIPDYQEPALRIAHTVIEVGALCARTLV